MTDPEIAKYLGRAGDALETLTRLLPSETAQLAAALRAYVHALADQVDTGIGVHTDPRIGSSPQDGDLVVVAIDGAFGTYADCRDCDGVMGVLVSKEPDSLHPWLIRHSTGETRVHAVRRPTEAELAAWALEHPNG